MKIKATFFALTLFIGVLGLHAQQSVTVRAKSYDVSDNLDLEAVASIFGDANNLEDFEETLNDPDMQLSNLDLNEDGYIDYLRVVESNSEGVYLVLIQAVLAQDVYQDVATIDVEKRSDNRVVVQVIGNDYIYGPNYIIEPVYVHRPVIYSFFWGPRYVTWNSPYYWGYYPGYYHYRAPRSSFMYCRGVYTHVNIRHTFNYVNHRRSVVAQRIYQRSGRNDYATRYPQRSFQKRNAGVSNKRQLTTSRGSVNRGAVRTAKAGNTPTQNSRTSSRQTVAKSQVRTNSPQRSASAGRSNVNKAPSRQAARTTPSRVSTPQRTSPSTSSNSGRAASTRTTSNHQQTTSSPTSRSSTVKNNPSRAANRSGARSTASKSKAQSRSSNNATRTQKAPASRSAKTVQPSRGASQNRGNSNTL